MTSKPWYDPQEAIAPAILAKLDPDFVALYTDAMNKNPGPPGRDDWAIDKIRADPMRLAPPCALDTKGHPRTAERAVPSADDDGVQIPVRVYYPDAAQHGPGPYPVHLNFHGV